MTNKQIIKYNNLKNEFLIKKWIYVSNIKSVPDLSKTTIFLLLKILFYYSNISFGKYDKKRYFMR